MDWDNVPEKLAELYPRAIVPAMVAARLARDRFDVPGFGPVMFKAATAFKPVADLFFGAQKPFGGPNPLLSMLLSGAAGAGVGYAGSKLYGSLMPQGTVDQERATHNGVLAGGLTGMAVPGLLWALPAYQAFGPKGLWSSPAKLAALVDKAALELNVAVKPDDLMQKVADAGAMFAPIVPVDSFNRVVLGDQHLSPDLRAATAGLTTGARLLSGSPMVSPADIARMAIGMGSGAVVGTAVGKVLGAVGALTPDAQAKIQQAGVLAGLIKSVVPLVFR